jgi:PAS domain S-box-containing protein
VIQIFNVGAEHMLGYAAADVVNKITPADISDPQELNVRAAALSLELGATINPGFEALVFKAARGIEDIYELTYIRKDGSRFPAVVSVTALRDDQNAIIGYLLIGTDNTARKQAEAARDSFAAQLRESQKMEAIGILAGGIAHDFNNALATISGNVELACQDLDRDSPALESLDEIRKAGLRMRDLVQQILSFSRRQPTERKRTSLAPIIGESARLLRATMPARMRLVVDCEAGVPDVLADVTQIEQVLINLATNAMQAMRGAPGQIDVRLDHVLVDAAMADRFQTLQSWRAIHPGRAIRLCVSDNGAGMDAVTLERIFEPFFTTKPVDEGTGLGLSVVHGIVQTHEGAITVESTPGVGTVLTLYLPPARARSLAPPRDMRVFDSGTAPEHGSGQHILYIDDDEALVFLVRRLLERRGYRLSGHVNQREALDALRADPAGFDLVVTDYNMPGMSGLDVARAIRAIRPDLPVVVASGFIDEALRANAPAAGVRELISKTGEAVDLCESLARPAQSLCRKAALT